jgi:FkbM family methyltransferase
MQNQVIDRVLSQWAGEPVLIDVGASGGAPEVWLPLASRSWYIAFDPDQREMAHASGDGGPFKRKTVVNEAITADPAATEVKFHLTRSPFCSSTLVPDRELVSNFFKCERFDILSEATARAATLDNVLSRLKIARLDWLKLDTQGTDKRIYESISEPVKRTMLAVDLEPGLRGAYVGEDLMGDVHATLRRDGFWLSRCDVKGLVRMRQSSLDELSSRHPEIDQAYVERGIRKTPGWTELRYIRSIESTLAAGGGKREMALLWVIATIDEQHGFALDVVGQWDKQFGPDESSRAMREESVARIRGAYTAAQQTTRRSLRKRLRGIVRRLIPKPAPSPTLAPNAR